MINSYRRENSTAVKFEQSKVITFCARITHQYELSEVE